MVGNGRKWKDNNIESEKEYKRESDHRNQIKQIISDMGFQNC